MPKKDKEIAKIPLENLKKLGKDEENEIDIHEVFQGLDNPLTLEEILVPPNAKTLTDVVSEVNGRRTPSASSSVIGTLIDPGKIGVIDHNGIVQLVGPGRWILPNPRSKLVMVVSLTENLIQYETLTIARIQRGEVGLAFQNGQPLLLGEGIHVRNDRLFSFVEAKSVNVQYLNHSSIHLLRIPKGNYGLVTESTFPKLLPEGVHITNSNVFTFDGVQIMNQPYVTHGTLHILRIPKGNVALVTDNNLPLLLEGTHCINSKTFTFHKMADLTSPVITHNTITRFIVRKGEIGLAWENNQPVFFEEGVYVKDSAFFIFDKFASASEKLITLGAKKIVTVWDGEVGVSFLKGKLIVLKPDRHLIDSTEHIFQGFLSTQQQCLRLSTLTVPNNSEKKKKVKEEEEEESILICETKDFVEIGLKADVFFKIEQAEKVLLVVGKDNVSTLVKDTAVATLNGIIRSTSLAEVAQNKEVSAKSQKNSEGNSNTAMFFDKVHDEFISKLHDSFMDLYGIAITNIRIESFRIVNSDLSNNISQQAFVTAQTQNQLTNLTGQTEIAVAQQRRDAEVNRIKAEGEAVKLNTEISAKNKAVMESAKAEADAQVIRAKAEAQAIELKAQAESTSVVVKAEAEAKRADMLNKTPLGGQIQLYQMYVEMVKHSMEGVQKVVYMPPESSSLMPLLAMQQNNPFFSQIATSASGRTRGYTACSECY